MTLEGSKIVITGANQGLGLAIADALAKEGADLLMGARGMDKLEVEAARLQAFAVPGQSIRSCRLDVSDRVSADAFTTEAERLWGKVDVLVNNAGVYGPKGDIGQVDWDEWVQAVNINLMGTVYLCRTFLPLLKKSRRGKIINLSGGGATAPLPRISAYAASKAAVVRFTETLAEELRTEQIDVNAIAPGALNTRLLDEVLAAGPEKVGQAFYDRAVKQKTEGGTPVGRGASLCAYLAGPSSDGVTGKLISAVWDPWEDFQDHREDLQRTDVYTLRRIVPKDRGLTWGND
jgi:NAD(P)-dependent dehydrogenase (short-subunit alcohol dehydrogenase family)